MVIDGINAAKFKAQYKTAIGTEFPDEMTITLGNVTQTFVRSKILTRYGTNPNQPFKLFVPEGRDDLVLGNMEVIKEGKEGFSLTNLQDESQALQLLRYFSEPACAVLKHLNPCGFQVSSDMSQVEIYKSARDADYMSSFGSVTVFNRPLTEETADEIMKLFTEVVVAPGYEDGAVDILRKNEGTKKRNNALRIVQYNPDFLANLPKFDGDDISGYINLKMLADGSMALEAPFLTQIRSIDDLAIHPYVTFKEEDIVGYATPTDGQLQDALTAIYLTMHTRSNAIDIVKNGRLLGIGTGQQKRIDSVKQAIGKSQEAEIDLEGAVLGSDAFFPNEDCVELAGKYGIRAVIWPAGSLQDRTTIGAANTNGIALIVPKNGERWFLHI